LVTVEEDDEDFRMDSKVRWDRCDLRGSSWCFQPARVKPN